MLYRFLKQLEDDFNIEFGLGLRTTTITTYDPAFVSKLLGSDFKVGLRGIQAAVS